jgi:formate hydrogenlyase subunit 4
MIHEGESLEYGGWQLALLQLAAQTRQLAFFALAAGIVMPSPLGVLAGVATLAVVVTFVENAFARLRLFEIPQLLATGLILAVASIAVRA